jgi:xylulokinase
VAAISISAQQHGLVALDSQGHVIRPSLLWNDTRSAAAATQLIEEFGAEALARRSGVVPVASFTITKLRWLRDAEPENAAIARLWSSRDEPPRPRFFGACDRSFRCIRHRLL